MYDEEFIIHEGETAVRDNIWVLLMERPIKGYHAKIIFYKTHKFRIDIVEDTTIGEKRKADILIKFVSANMKQNEFYGEVVDMLLGRPSPMEMLKIARDRPELFAD